MLRAAFKKFGGQAEFKLRPPFGKDGHSLLAKGRKTREQGMGAYRD
ncbi:hypothetical protein GCM10011396_36990 [Undibacterium terreum]|uniref:Uncharacterized protein n=1 Tax=Undibacterium terreum TaxID=1224302 RepID=A0A916UTR2_9BURK|nr:hypothetical protein GCM10011396_36990 [Undibacterium terreum]